MPELSETEKKFIEETLAKNDSVSFSDDQVLVKKKIRVKRKRRMPWRSIRSWAIAIMLIPITITTVFIYGIVRAESIVGKSSLDWLGNQNVSPEMKKVAAGAGYGWLPEFAKIYTHRAEIIASLFTVAIVIVALMFIVDALRNNKNKENIEDEEENE